MNSQLIIKQSQLQQIYLHAETIYPEECCGLILGTNNNNQKTVTEVWETENSWDNNIIEDFKKINPLQGSKRNRFSIDPKILLKAQKNSRERNLLILGIYHSHPDNQAIPSEFDRKIAWSEYSYLIVSVIDRKVNGCFSWVLNNQHQFEPESIKILDD